MRGLLAVAAAHGIFIIIIYAIYLEIVVTTKLPVGIKILNAHSYMFFVTTILRYSIHVKSIPYNIIVSLSF